MPIVKDFCKCMNLKNGSIFVGALDLALIVASFILWVGFQTMQLYDNMHGGIEVVLGLLNSILLIVGAVLNSQWFLVPWIILGIYYIIDNFKKSVVASVLSFQGDNPQYFQGIFWLVFAVCGMPFHAYLWVVVMSFFLQLRGEDL